MSKDEREAREATIRELQKLQWMEENSWRKKSRAPWLNEGDRTLSFSTVWLMQRRGSITLVESARGMTLLVIVKRSRRRLLSSLRKSIL